MTLIGYNEAFDEEAAQMLTRYMVGLALIWGITAIIIVPLGNLAYGLTASWVGPILSSLSLVLLAGYAHRRWRRLMEPHLPKTVGPQHGSV